MRTIEIKGDSSEDKFKSLEVILKRMFRRLNKSIIGVMPYTPVIEYCDKPDEGLICRHLIPGDCILKSMDFFVGNLEYDDEGKAIDPEFKLTVRRGTKTISDTMYKDKPAQPINTKVELFYNDIVELSTSNNISQISYTLVLEFKSNFQAKQSFLIEELEKLIEE